MIQSDFKLPMHDEGWRHYKGELYEIVGLAHDENGNVVVVYKDYGWADSENGPLYVQPLGRFLQEVENKKPRFRFEREPAGR